MTEGQGESGDHGALMIAIGVMMFLLCGACTASFGLPMLFGDWRDPYIGMLLPFVVVLGLLPMGIGAFLVWLGVKRLHGD